MVELQRDRLDAVFHSLADPTRREMLRRLGGGECTVSELAAPFAMSLAAASKHIRMLERAGLVERSIEGRRHICRIAPEPLGEAQQWISEVRQFWGLRLDMLEALLSEANEPAGKGSRPEAGAKRVAKARVARGSARDGKQQ